MGPSRVAVECWRSGDLSLLLREMETFQFVVWLSLRHRFHTLLRVCRLQYGLIQCRRSAIYFSFRWPRNLPLFVLCIRIHVLEVHTTVWHRIFVSDVCLLLHYRQLCCKAGRRYGGYILDKKYSSLVEHSVRFIGIQLHRFLCYHRTCHSWKKSLHTWFKQERWFS